MGLIVSIIISIAIPDLDQSACDALLGQLPSALLDADACSCDLNIGGIFSIDLAAQAVCVIEYDNDQTCELEISGGGDALSVAFGGNGPLTLTSDCDINEGNIDLEVSGSFSTSSIELNTCSVELTYGNPQEVARCDCDSIGCNNDFFAASISCKNNNDETIFDEECINFTELADSFSKSDVPVSA